MLKAGVLCVGCPVIQANGRLTFKDDLRSGGVLHFTAQWTSIRTELANIAVNQGECDGYFELWDTSHSSKYYRQAAMGLRCVQCSDNAILEKINSTAKGQFNSEWIHHFSQNANQKF